MGDELRWEAPGPGDWWLVREHLPYPVSRLLWSLFPPVTAGWKSGGARYGLPTGEPRWGLVNSWVYIGPEVPLTAEELATRERTAATTLATAPWRDEVRRWHDDERPQVVAANRILQQTDPAVLGNGELELHLAAAAHAFSRWAPLHFEHCGFDLAAGLLLEAGLGWGLAPEEVIELLAGASPASRAVDERLGALAAELDRGGAPAPITSLSELRSAGPAASAMLDDYLDDYGCRLLTGHDVTGPTVVERPAVLLAAVDARRRRPAQAPVADPAAVVRTRVPAGERDRFDELLADARTAYGLRDDDVGVCWNWPLGLLRRAALEVGRRLAAQGRLPDERLVLEAELAEARALASGHGPSADELVDRRQRRLVAASADPPPHLAGGGEVAAGTSAPVELPPAVARLAQVRAVTWSVAPPRAGGPLTGVGIGSTSVTGPARLVRHVDELDRVAPGDVLVTVATTAAFNTIFPLLAAVVTEHGSLLSHTAVLAREVGVPAVVGVSGVLAQVADGDVVEVDPVAGSVRIVHRAG